MFKIGFAILAGIFLSSSVQVEKLPVERVRECVDQYPEVLWLADANVRKTEEGTGAHSGTYSEQLFGQKYVEFDRTIMTLHCLKLVLDGSDIAYQEFTKDQPENVRLSRQNFALLHQKGQELLKTQDLRVLETSLVLGDIGKSEKARAVFKPYGAKAPDHDDFHEEVMKILQNNPRLCPSFDRLDANGKKLLCQTANLAHFGHITHLEGGPSMFSQLKKSKVSSAELEFALFVHTCDVAGALGHVNKESSLVYTETSHLAMEAMRNACRLLLDETKTELDAYNAYLTIRAEWLGLDPNDRISRVLARVGASLRLFTPEEGRILKEAVLKLDAETKELIISQLDGKEFGRTPTYIPAVLVNLANNTKLGATKEERLTKSALLGLPFVARVLEQHEKNESADLSIPLNFNQVAGVAKTNPNLLTNDFIIDSEGNVCIQ